MWASQTCTLRWCASPAVSWRSSDWPCWISDRQTSYQSSTAGMRYNSQTFTNNPDLLMNRSVTCRNNLTTAYVTTSRYIGVVITNNCIKIQVVILVVEFEKFFLFFQIHGSTRRYNKSPSLWCTVHAFHNNVL